jgi:2',3'-cyclic-nucleotide 2'-phosphodiesterase (5'-nucleotidase family)
VKGIDIILGGHDHLPYGEFHEDTFIFKCGESAHWLGCLDIDIEITVAPDGTKETHVCATRAMPR